LSAVGWVERSETHHFLSNLFHHAYSHSKFNVVAKIAVAIKICRCHKNETRWVSLRSTHPTTLKMTENFEIHDTNADQSPQFPKPYQGVPCRKKGVTQ